MSSEGSRADAGNQTPAGVCGEARLLLNGFGQAVQAAVELYRAQLDAVADGDLEAGRFDLLIHEAIETKLEAKYAYLAHIRVHGCSTTDDDQSDDRRTGTNS